MGRIRQLRLSWRPSELNPNVGYRLYWSNEIPISYDCNFFKLGNTTSVNLTDILLKSAPLGESIYIGISTVDEAGNESDIISLSEPYCVSVPLAPRDLVVTSLDDLKVIETEREAENQTQQRQKSTNQHVDQKFQPENPKPRSRHITTEGAIVDDFSFRVRKALED